MSTDRLYAVLAGAVGGVLVMAFGRYLVWLVVGAAWFLTAPFRWLRRRWLLRRDPSRPKWKD